MPWRRRPEVAPPPGPPAESLWAVTPPPGVRLLSSRPARTGQGGEGIVARYSDGTTVTAMVNSDGSLRLLFFRDGQAVPAVPLDGPTGQGFTWHSKPAAVRGKKPAG